MAIASSQAGVRTDLDLVDRWFRALDQRRVQSGHQEWLIHVTSIFVDEREGAWIQIADGVNGASIVLRVGSSTSLEIAIRALMNREAARAVAHPLVVTAIGSAVPYERHNAVIALG